MDVKLDTSKEPMMDEYENPPLTPIPPVPEPDLNNRDTLEKIITENYMYLVNRLNPRDFFPYLRQERCFTVADQEEIMHMQISIDKAGHLIDLVLRKDTHCLESFFVVLEYSYEECFVKLTGKKPRPKPAEWDQINPPRNVMRNSMTQVEGIMVTLTNILNQLCTNKVQMNELTDHIKTVRDQEDREGEEDIIKLKDRIFHLKKENVELCLENNLMKQRVDRERAKSRKLNDLESKTVQLRQELREKEEELDKLKKTYMMKQVLNALGSRNDDPHIDKLTKQLIEIEAELRNEQEEKRRMRDEMEEMEKLINKRHEENSKLQERVNALITKQDELDNKCYWLERARSRGTRADGPPTSLRRRDMPLPTPDVPVYDTIPGKKPFVVDERGYATVTEKELIEESHSDDENQKPQFKQQTSVELRHRDSTESIQKQIDRLSKTLSTVSVTDINKEPCGFYKSPELQYPDLVKAKKGKDSVKLSPMRASIVTIEVEASVLEQHVKIDGGNHSGIFITGVDKEESTEGEKKKVLHRGDQLIKVRKLGKDESSAMCLGDCTLEEAHSILRSQNGMVELFTWSRMDAFQDYLNQVGSDYRGDLFCIYIYNQPTNTEKITDYLHVKAGDVLLITDTMCSSNILWKARKVDTKTGKQLVPLQQGHIPSFSQTNTGSFVRRPIKTKKRIYTYVQPFKANFSRPVILCGQDSIVERVFKAVKADSEIELLEGQDNQVSRVAEKISVLKEKRIMLIDQQKLIPEMIKQNIYPIVIVLDCPTMSNQAEDDLKKGIPLYLVDVVDVTRDMLMKGEEILKDVKQHITKVQDQIVWMEKDRPCLPVMV